MKQKMDISLKKCVTPKFRASFPHLAEKQGPKGSEPKFSITMLFAKDVDLAGLKKAAFNAAVEAWGKNKDKWPKKRRSPFQDGDEKSDLTGYAGMITVKASSKQPPGVVDKHKQEIPHEDIAQEVYAGCYARATVIAFAYENAGNVGVSFALQNVIKVGDGPKFSGKKSAAEDFADLEIEDTDSAEDDEDNYKEEKSDDSEE